MSRVHVRGVGVDLGSLCVKQPVTMESLGGKIVAVDAFNTLYQFLASLRQPDGTPLKDDQGRVTSHLVGLFNRTANLVEAGILPVFVFDGVPHPLKRATVEERRRIRQEAQAAYESAVAAGDLELARTKAQQTGTLTTDMVRQAQHLLQLLGLPFVEAPGEGEAQGSYFAQRGAVHAVSSQDFDALLFGTPRLVRNLAVTGRRKMPGRSAYVDVEPELIPLSETLQGLRLTREQLVDAAILIGTDFNEGVVGIGPKTALELVRDHRSLEALLEKCETESGAVWKKLREGQDGLGEFEAIRNLFLHPQVKEPTEFRAGPLDERGVASLLVGEHRFSKDRVESALKRYRESKVYQRQKTLGDWG